MKVSIKQKMALYFLFSLVIPMLIFSVYIPRTTRNLVYDERKGMLENNMDIVFSQLEVVNEDYKNGKFNTIDDAKQQAAHIISSYRYGSDGKDYFWIQENIEGNATMVMHPYLSNLNRTDVSNYKDQSGNRIFSQAQDICNKKDDTPREGYLTYYWAYYKNANQTKQKMSFVKSFEDWGWIVGTGVYINDVETLISSKITNQMLLFILPTII